MTSDPQGIFDIKHELQRNQLIYGDNLTIMKDMPSGSVDLIYLDPPFNSQRNYNLIYKKLTGQPVPEQEEAFCDAWDMDPEKEKMVRDMPIVLRDYGADEGLIRFWEAWIKALRQTQPRLLAYLIYMSYRLFEMRRILKSTGAIYLHCDPTASHYIKVIMDGVFGHQMFMNEITWKRTSAHNSAKRYGPVHDTLLYYAKSDKHTWNGAYTDLDPDYVEHFYRGTDPDGRRYRLSDLTAAGTRNGESGKPWRGIDPTDVGRHWTAVHATLDAWDAAGLIHWPPKGTKPSYKRYLDQMKGQPASDIWTDVPVIAAHAEERLGYPTQKPISLLKRIIEASSNPGDVVFDPFAGCGTAVYAAHLLGRKWIGCDIAILSVQIVRDVLLKRYGLKEGEHYFIHGVPRSVEAAQVLFSQDTRQFQHWSVELAGGFASTKHSDDRGIDGRIHFETKEGLKNMVLSVKGGKLTPAFMRELRGTFEREEDTEMGGFICLQPTTKGIDREIAAAGMYTYQGIDYPRLQLRTIEDLLAGRLFDTPSRVQTLHSRTLQTVLPLGV